MIFFLSIFIQKLFFAQLPIFNLFELETERTEMINNTIDSFFQKKKNSFYDFHLDFCCENLKPVFRKSFFLVFI